MATTGRGNKFSKLKYEERVRDEINLALRREFADPRLMNVSITHVELTQDHSHAKVYWDTFNTATKKVLDGFSQSINYFFVLDIVLIHVNQQMVLFDSKASCQQFNE